MVAQGTRKILAVLLSLVLMTSTPYFYGYQTAGSPPPGNGGASEPAPMTADELDHLVSPIALYPDALVAQVLGAATFPDQVAAATYWLKQNKNLTGNALVQAVDQQAWDPSVKALTQFPTVLENMSNNLSWTSTLGEAYHNQQADVMAAIQAMRAKAKAAGNLQSGSQIKVVQQSPQTIIIEPANPQVVYVPQYNPAVIYGAPYSPPGYSAGDLAAASVLSFGAGIAVGALMAGGTSWGWSAWGCNWHGGTVVYNHTTFVGNTAWHGGGYYGGYGYHGGYGYGYHASGPYGGASTYHGAYGSAATYHGYGPNGTYHTGSAYNSAWGSGASHTAYAPDGASHTSGGGYNASTGGSYHYGSSTDAYGGSSYHGTSSTGEHYAGGTTASGQHWGGSSSSDWASRSDSDRGWSSMRASGYSGGRFGGGGFGGGGFRR